MSMSLGISCDEGGWRACLQHDGHVQAYLAGVEVRELLSFIEQSRSVFPELLVAIASSLDVPLCMLPEAINVQASDSGVGRNEWGGLRQFLAGCAELFPASYHVPGVQYVLTVPRYRLLMRPELGGSVQVAIVAALLYRMRLREAGWEEMRFLCLVVGQAGYQITVIMDGQIVDGISATFAVAEGITEREVWIEQAFWERLSQDLASLCATHQLEDIIITKGASSNAGAMSSEMVTERFETRYQFYQFPHDEDELDGSVAAIGAAVIGAGLAGSGQAAEVTHRLFAVVPE